MQSIREVMTPAPVALMSTSTAADAARSMREADIGDVVVQDDRGNLAGIVTDRDITLRVCADGLDPNQVLLSDICTRAIVTLSPADTVEDAVRLMRECALRRLPVVDAAQVVGIVSLGDLALERDPQSVLAGISSATPNN